MLLGAGEMTQRVKALAVKADEWSGILEIHMVEGEDQLLQVVLWLIHISITLHTNR